ncbi:MAG: RsmE family RNA methyltransferase [Spirochaetia bacterium]|nr:RsmE family RNA methyltransferase [Spirochaetia bacterium]
MRQFVSSVYPDKKGMLELCGKDFRYLKQVLRLCVGDMLYVRLPDGKLSGTTVAKIDESKKTVFLQVCDCAPEVLKNGGENQSDYRPETDFYLFQFVAKGPKMDLIVRQAAECGVLKVVPVTGKFTQSCGAEKNLRNSRYERIVKEARQQSGSPVATEISETLSLEEACALWKKVAGEKPEESFACVLYERSERTKNLYEALADLNVIKKCAVFCGAEGGISPEEIDFLLENGIVPVHFETNILRCETAALYGTACLQNAVTGRKLWQKK